MDSTLASISELTRRIPSYQENKIVYGVIVFVLLFSIIYFLKQSNNNNNIEHMSGGTLQQLFANDAQNINLNGVISESKNLTFNLPTKILQGTQRGAPVSISCNNIDTETVLAYTGDSGLAPFPYITPPSIIKQG
jgi:hypothetical protein